MSSTKKPKKKKSRTARRGERPTFAEWARDAMAVEPQLLKKFIRKSLRSKRMLHVFGRFFFPHVIWGEYETPEAHLDLIDDISSPHDSGIVFPRGFAKTTWEKVDTIHDIVYDLEEVIVFYGATADDVGMHFDAIRMELETNEHLREVYGDLVPDIGRRGMKWNSRHFKTTNGINVIGRGAEKGRGINIDGKRPSKIVIDDGETDEMVASSMRRAKYWKWLTEVVMPSLAKRGKLKVIGTVIHPECAVLRFHEENGGIFRKAIESDRSIWPQHWPVDDLLKKRDGYVDDDGQHHEGIGVRAFSQEYLNTPINDETGVFRQEWLDDNAYERLPDDWRQAFDVAIHVDPAAGESEMADFYGLAAVGRDRRDGLYWVMEATHFGGKYKGQIKAALVWATLHYLRWQPVRVVGIEVVLNQTAFHQIAKDGCDFLDPKVRGMVPYICDQIGTMRLTDDEMDELGTVRMPVREVSPEGKDKVNRARHHEPKVEQGLVRFSPKHSTFYKEMIEFPNGSHDDTVDAFVEALSLVARKRDRLKTRKKSPMLTAGLRAKQF